jgi:hypothetical protein
MIEPSLLAASVAWNTRRMAGGVENLLLRTEASEMVRQQFPVLLLRFVQGVDERWPFP